VDLDSLRKGTAAVANDPEPEIPDLGDRLAPLDRDPDFRGQLRADAVKAERGQQADHTRRCRHGGQHQPVVLGDLRLREAIPSACHALERALHDKTGQRLRVDAGRRRRPGVHEPTLADQLQEPLALRVANV
jgi:hypothetical protein